MRTNYLLLLLLGCLTRTLIAQENKGKILLLVEHIRHGARTPDFKATKLDWIEKFGYGELTTNGIRMQYTLGVNTKKRYPTIFEDTFTADEYFVRSTHYNRTIMSAFAHLIGTVTFPKYRVNMPPNDQRMLPPQDLLFKPEVDFKDFETALPGDHVVFPIHSVLGKDYQMTSFICPGLLKTEPEARDAASKRLEANDITRKVVQQAKILYNIDDNWKKSSTILDQCFELADIAMMDYLNNDKSVMGDNKDLLDQLERCYSIWIGSSTTPQKAQKLTSSYFLLSIVDWMDAKIASVKEPNNPSKKYNYRYILVSGHDSTLTPQLQLFKLFNVDCVIDEMLNNKKDEKCNHIPPVASNVIYELAEIDGGYFVRFSYNNKYFPVCEGTKKEDNYACNYDTFKKRIIEELTVPDFDKQCFTSEISGPEDNNKDNAQPNKLFDWKMWLIVVLGILIIILLLTTVVLFMMLNNKESNMSNSLLSGREI